MIDLDTSIFFVLLIIIALVGLVFRVLYIFKSLGEVFNTLVIPVFKFLYGVFKNYTHRPVTSRNNKLTTEYRTKKAPLQHKKFKEPNTAKQPVTTYYPAISNAYTAVSKFSSGKHQSQKTLQPLQKKPFLGQNHSLEKKLARYHSVHKAIIMHELLAPKHIT